MVLCSSVCEATYGLRGLLKRTTCASIHIYNSLAADSSAEAAAKSRETHISDAIAVPLELDQLLWRNDGHLARYARHSNFLQTISQ